jgi:predicted ATPase
MAQHPFLKSIKPVNLLSFGPNTEEIELRPLNILIGPNGSGKSNLIEIVRLLCWLPEKEPWSGVQSSGGVDEWIWKGGKGRIASCSLTSKIQLSSIPEVRIAGIPPSFLFLHEIHLEKFQTSLRVSKEIIRTSEPEHGGPLRYNWFEGTGMRGQIHLRNTLGTDADLFVDLNADRSVLGQLTSLPVQRAGIGTALPEVFEISSFFDSIEFHQDWEFGADLSARNPIPAGQTADRLLEDASNLAQVLARYKDTDPVIFERINELMAQFYAPAKRVDVRIISTHLQVALQEEGGISIPAYRLSDGTLRWLALLAVLLNPTPAPVTCIEEPELGLHPDIIPVLADLLKDASTRTQLILTTHSQALVECFSDEPEVVCVCEKVEGATQITRLSGEHLASWLEDYSLGQLWAKGEIGGNRW